MATGRVPTTANSPLTAKGDLFGYSTTQARVPVGNDGETLVADSSASTGLRYNPQNALANPVINGGMDIWQRGTSAAITAATTSFFGPDRWALYRGVSGSTYSRQTVSDTTNLPNIQYALRIQRDSGNTSTSNINALNNFETVNSIPFVGKTVTLSFYARRGANYSAASNVLAVWLRQGTGTDQNFYNDYTNVSNVTTSDVTLTTSWQRFALTGTVATNTTELAVQFQINPTGTAGAADWAEITGVQIDLGTYTASSAPTFRRSGGTLAGEYLACCRYFQILDGTKNWGWGAAGSTTIVGRYFIPTPFLRTGTIPSITLSGTPQVYDGVTQTNITSIDSIGIVSSGGVHVNLNVASGLTQYRPYTLYANNGTVNISAEL